MCANPGSEDPVGGLSERILKLAGSALVGPQVDGDFASVIRRDIVRIAYAE
ncbi:MAG: hypothetical protein ACR2NM_11575 [Bythopirellula sp.]